MHPIINDYKTNTQKTIFLLKEELKSIRTGRANPAMFESVVVEAYGGSMKMKLNELASMTMEGPATIAIVPFDPSTSTDIEKAILKSPLGVTPQPQGTKLLVTIPPLSEEQREKMMKMVNTMIEDRKVSIRGQRDDARKKIKTLFDAKEISEDQKFRFEKEIETITQQLMTEVQDIKDRKEEEIKQV